MTLTQYSQYVTLPFQKLLLKLLLIIWKPMKCGK